MPADLTVRRWQKFGHDRVYVNGADGRWVGYWDKRTGKATIRQADCADEFWKALAPHLPTQRVEQAVASPEGGATQPLTPAQPPYVVPVPAQAVRDLAQNRPGQGLLERAAQARQQRPVWTRVARLLNVHTQERADRVGAQGEIAVARRLARLGPQWRVLHSIPVSSGGRDIDHLVIGPSGVFSVNAKHHPTARVWVANETFMINGTRQPYVHKSRYEAVHAAGRLAAILGRPVPVTGIIAVMGVAGGFTVKEQPRHGEVVVTTRRAVHRMLRKRPERLAPSEVAEIFAVARLSTTWLPVT